MRKKLRSIFLTITWTLTIKVLEKYLSEQYPVINNLYILPTLIQVGMIIEKKNKLKSILFLSFWLIRSLMIFFFLFVICSHLHQFMETLRKECHWLRSMSWQVSILCTICLEERVRNDDSCTCMRHNKEKACLHHDCAEYIPLETSGWCARTGRHITKDRLQPWIEVSLDAWYKYLLPFL